jgi:hypothetical protein
MASTDTRSGFRLPWSSDRSHEDTAPETAAEVTTEPAEATTDPAATGWPATDTPVAPRPDGADSPSLEADGSATPDAEEPAPMVELDTVAGAAPVTTTKKSLKLMAELTAAIRATAETAREQALSQVDADVKQVEDTIREAATEGAAALKRQSEEDVASIREWSKAEIARIREETESRINSRKATLEDELAGHAAAVERRVDEVRAEVARFQAQMESYVASLLAEDDPSTLAAMAETMPESPSFDAWANLDDLDITLAPEPEPEFEPAPEPEAVEAVVEPVEADPWAGAAAVETDAEPEPEAVEAVVEPVEAVVESVEADPEAGWEAAEASAELGEAEAEEPEAAVEAVEAQGATEAAEVGPWGDSVSAWKGGDPSSASDVAHDDDDSIRWAAGDTPDGFPTGDTDANGDPVDRGAIMAALEAAAEAVVAAESAAESADQAEAAADVAETAAGLIAGRTHDDTDPEAAAALSARVDAGGFETESFADRLASLLPHTEAAGGDETMTTQVVVTGLVSVASIASFKRHLGRLQGVQSVGVASGPEGEFVFNLTHRADLSFRDAIPTMPGFAARVTGTGDGVVHVTARDPEAEG